MPPQSPTMSRVMRMCAYRARRMSIFLADYQQVIVHLEKLSPKNLRMSKVVITFEPSINN